jgi:hypothetical protein
LSEESAGVCGIVVGAAKVLLLDIVVFWALCGGVTILSLPTGDVGEGEAGESSTRTCNA